MALDSHAHTHHSLLWREKSLAGLWEGAQCFCSLTSFSFPEPEQSSSTKPTQEQHRYSNMTWNNASSSCLTHHGIRALSPNSLNPDTFWHCLGSFNFLFLRELETAFTQHIHLQSTHTNFFSVIYQKIFLFFISLPGMAHGLVCSTPPQVKVGICPVLYP